MKSFLAFCDKFEQGFKNTLKTCCPCCYSLLCTEHYQHRKFKAVIGFIYGIVLGIILYFTILIDLGFGNIITLCLGAFITFFLALGNALSTQVRCVTLLTLPSFCGKSGRGVLKTIVLVYVLGGPFMTISNNAKEAVRVFGCTTTLAYNLTRARHELTIQPFQEALYQLKRETNQVAETLQSVQEVLEPIFQEVEEKDEIFDYQQRIDDIDVIQGYDSRRKYIEEKYTLTKKTAETENREGEMYETIYKKKLEYRCQDIINEGTNRCLKIFGDAFDRCNEITSSMSSLLCWPMKLNFICNLPQVFGDTAVCDPSKVIQPGFGRGYETLKDVSSRMEDNFQDVNIQVEIKDPPGKVNTRSATDVARKITKTFEDKKTIFDVIILFIKRLLAIIFLRIVYKAAQYHDKYLTDIEFDNEYITKYFRHIDERRRKRGQTTILPAKKIERKKFIDPYTTLPMSEERRRILGQSFKLVLEMITATTFILLDRLFYETLDIVARHAMLEYNQSNESDVTLTVHGTGMIANLMRSIVNGFNLKRRVRVVRANMTCLPRPMILSNYYLYKIYGTYFLIWVFILLEGYTQRMNRAICAYFYRKREKKRILFLYNETLKRRNAFFRYLKGRIRRQAREINLSFEANILLAFRLRHRKNFDWLRWFPMAKRKCLICGDPEPSKRGVFYECATRACDFVHCQECWEDVGKVCYGCNPLESNYDEDYFG